MDLSTKIKGIEYKPLLCRKLNTYKVNELQKGLSKDATFILNVNKNQIAISWWVSPKRTRSYPYARVYDSLGFSGKKATIIPIMKDEGKRGDRDFLQWDTISLMSLLGIYVIIAYYVDGQRSSRYRDKITEQRFDIQYLKRQIKKLLSYQSDALHWNLDQLEKVGKIGEKALNLYERISKKLKVKIHSSEFAKKRIKELLKGKEQFMKLSRNLAKKAQKRESLTIQPKEKLTGKKAVITIKNYLGGYYYFTVDEIEMKKESISLIEGKYTKVANLPALEDIKDGLMKMILFTNLEEVKIKKKLYIPVPILKLTTRKGFKVNKLNQSQRNILNLL